MHEDSWKQWVRAVFGYWSLAFAAASLLLAADLLSQDGAPIEPMPHDQPQGLVPTPLPADREAANSSQASKAYEKGREERRYVESTQTLGPFAFLPRIFGLSVPQIPWLSQRGIDYSFSFSLRITRLQQVAGGATLYLGPYRGFEWIGGIWGGVVDAEVGRGGTKIGVGWGAFRRFLNVVPVFAFDVRASWFQAQGNNPKMRDGQNYIGVEAAFKVFAVGLQIGGYGRISDDPRSAREYLDVGIVFWL